MLVQLAVLLEDHPAAGRELTGLVELPEPSLEMGERVPHPALDRPIAALGRKDRPASFDGLDDRRRARVEVGTEVAVGIAELPIVATAPGMIDHVEHRSFGRRSFTRPPADVGEGHRRACQAVRVTGRLEQDDRGLGVAPRLVELAAVRGDVVPVLHERERMESLVTGRLGASAHVEEDLVGPLELAGIGQRRAQVDEVPIARGVVEGQKRGRARQEIRRRSGIAAGHGPRCGGAQVLRGSTGQLGATAAHQSELDLVADGLLEVIADDLLDLGQAVARGGRSNQSANRSWRSARSALGSDS